MTEVGNFSLVLALFVSIVQALVPSYGVLRRQLSLQNLAKVLVILQFILVSIAFFILVNAFLNDNFIVKYVANNSNSRLPELFKMAATWGGHEGSMLLWIYIMSAWTLAVSIFSKILPKKITTIILAVMGLISSFFIAFLIFTSNPFELLTFVPEEGRDLNPLLQDIGLIIHPPMLYMGYVGTIVPFAFIVASLIDGKLDNNFLRWSRPWALVAFAFLTFGIVLGSWWAYYELGWGGWWFWDPVENASFMPWLALLALIHSFSVSEKRGAFKHWSVLLAITGFSLSLLGAFLVRSGVLTSVHSFAADPDRGLFILLILFFVIISSLALYLFRFNKLISEVKFAFLSKETFLAINNILVVAALFTVFLGTLFPLFLDALSLSKISVGEPYFNAVFVPIMLPAVLIMSIGSFVRWKSDNPGRLINKLTGIWVAAIIILIISIFFTRNIFVLLAIFIFVWIVMHSLYQLLSIVKNFSFAILGMVLAHIGVAVFILGATTTTQFGIEKDLKMSVGDSITIKGNEFVFNGVKDNVGPNYSGYKGEIIVNDKIKLYPEKRNYLSGMPMTEAGIDANLGRDLFTALGTDLGSGAWSVRLYYKPLVRLIWLGGLLIMLGALFAAFDRRYRKRKYVVD